MKDRLGGRLAAVVVAVLAALADVSAAMGCRGEGLMSNHTSGCREYFRCRNGLVSGTYACPQGFVFNEAAHQCLPSGKTPCIRHVCDPDDIKFYTAPGTQCRYYYKCDKGTALELACPTGSWFDFGKQQCTRSAGVCYEPVCTGQTDGRYPDTTQACKRSLVCSGGDIAAVESPGPLTGGCPSPRATSVAFPIAGSDRCASLPDGPHPAPGGHCKDYVVCKGGETQATMHCPDNTRFDGQKCSAEESTPCVDECSDREDGFHADMASGCRDYFYCQDRRSFLRTTCAEGTLFDGQMCISSAFYNCPVMIRENPCIGKADGYQRDFKDCKSFVYCSNEDIKFKDSCVGEKVWNGSVCVDPGEFQCEGPIQWSGCAERMSGYHQDRTRGSDCKRYYHCSKDKRIDFACPANQIFNGEECVHDDLYTCPSLEKDSCEFKSDGYYQQTSGDCRAYYMCSGTNKIIYLCDIDQVFNGEKCVDKRDYKCPYHTEDCLGKSNGYHQDVNTNCRKYYFCDNGQKLITLQCSGSKLFNGRGCVAPKEYHCPTGQGPNPCNQRPDGHYAQDGTKCRQYFKCGGRKVVSRHNCPVNQIFDGAGGCVEKTCPVQVVTCERNGLFMDLQSRCTQYHICIDKRKSTLQCEPGKLFDGQLCVPEDSFTCPNECSQQHCGH